MERNDSVQKPECRVRSNIRSDAGRGVSEFNSVPLYQGDSTKQRGENGDKDTEQPFSYAHSNAIPLDR